MGRQEYQPLLPNSKVALLQHTPRRRCCLLRGLMFLLVATPLLFLYLGYNTFSAFPPDCSPNRDDIIPKCPSQPPAMAPEVVWKPEESQEWIDKSAETLGGAVRIPTVSYDDMALDPTEDERFKVLDRLHDYLNQTFPLFHAKARLTKVNTYGLLYELPGSDLSLKPALYAAHQDVVPVPKDTESRWSHPPFGGVYDKETGLLWGRGASDDKNMLIAIFEALEQLERQGFENKRSILLASGFDEEIGGKRGAATLGQELKSRYGSDDSIEFVLDEGGLGIGTTQQGQLDVAMPAVGEKGYADVKISITTEGGHSSVPPDHTAIGMLSDILVTLEAHPLKPTLSSHNPILTHLICMSDALDAYKIDLSSTDKVPGFILDRTLRKQLRDPRKWEEAAARIAKEGTRPERYVIQTSQAVDVITGGAKANALPESASATVNHRVSVDSNLKEIKKRIKKLVGRVAERYNLDLLAFDGDEANTIRRQDSAGEVKLELVQASEPTRISSALSPQFGRLAATIRHVFPGRQGRERLVTPVIMTGNTDTRWYLDLSANIWRFHPNTFMMFSGKHAIDERMDMFSHAQTTRFMHAFIQNTDIKLD